MSRRNWGSIALILAALPAAAQQTGTIAGKVTSPDGKPLQGVRIDITGNTLPQGKRATTNAAGDYRMPFLPPGDYTLSFIRKDKVAQKRTTKVYLDQTSAVSVTLADSVTGAVVEVVGQKVALVDTTSSEVKSSFSSDVINSLPMGQDYRDLVKLIPGVMYTQDAVRGPSAGGSGQDNVHQFDGVNVNLPMYGTMSSEPSGHDIDQVTVNKGGSDATGFNRSAGYNINSVSKSGTNAFTGEVSYKILPENLVATRRARGTNTYEQEKTYATVNLGGPLVQDRLFYFLSFYRPTTTNANSANNYGATPNREDKRTEVFGKLTYAPLPSLLLHASHRDSKNTAEHVGYASSAAHPSTGNGSETKMEITTLEGTWTINQNSFLNFKSTNFMNKSSDHPDTFINVQPEFGTTRLDVANLATQGLFTVPSLRTGTTAADLAYNAFVTPLINQYGYLNASGVPTGGGTVGGWREINTQNFYRRNHQLAYDAVWGTEVTHTFHAGVQWFKEMEDLYRVSNGWGSITGATPSGSTYPPRSPVLSQPYSFIANVNQQGIAKVPFIHSEYESKNIEINDKIKWNQFTFNVGFLASNDKLIGSGLKPDAAAYGGWVKARGVKYTEHEVKFSDTLQPRLGVVWNYRKDDTVYFNYARFVPSVSSLPRAASWDRNLIAQMNVYFDAAGNQVDRQPEASSTGKLFQDGLKPRHTDEILIGTTRDLGHHMSGRLYGRYRKSVNFWEDTNNGARVMFAHPDSVPSTYYIPDLDLRINAINGATTYANILATRNVYVIANMDGAFTKFYEVGAEFEYTSDKIYLNASYTWSHYYGNFDQDNTTSTLSNDSNIFIGSSNIADDFGRQTWNYKYGNLSGDRRHKLKAFGSYKLPWKASAGLYFIYQSGQPWQYSDYNIYTADRTAQGSTSSSDVNRYAEPAGSRRTNPHAQFDATYTQTCWQKGRLKIEAQVDVFNLFNIQTGYNIQSNKNTTATAGMPQSFYTPRRTQLGIRATF